MSTLWLLAQTTTAAGAGATSGSGAGGDNWVLMAAVILLSSAVGLFIVELFVPTGGVLGVLSACCLVVGVIMLCTVNLTWGLAAGLVAVCALPAAIMLGLKVWPDTPIGRWLTLRDEQQAVTQRTEDEPGRAADPRVGKEGRALTDLRPIGSCLIDGKRAECIASRGMIEKGDPVRVVAVEGMQLRVEKLDA